MKKYDNQLVIFFIYFFISASTYPISEKLLKIASTGVGSAVVKHSFEHMGWLAAQGDNFVYSAAQVAGVGAFLYMPFYLANTSEDIHEKANNQARAYIRNEKQQIYTSLKKLMQSSDTISKVNTTENSDFNMLLQAQWRLKKFNWPKHYEEDSGVFWTPRMLMSIGIIASFESSPKVAAAGFLGSYIASLGSHIRGYQKNEYCMNMPQEIEREIIQGVYVSDQKFVNYIQQHVQYIANQCEKIKKGDAHFANIYHQTTRSYDIPTKAEICRWYQNQNSVCCKDKINCKINSMLCKIADDSNN